MASADRPSTHARNEVHALNGHITLTIVAAGILASCERSSLKNESQASSTTRPLVDSSLLARSALIASPFQAADTLADTVDFTCSPSLATVKDTITLRMRTPHGEYLTVMQPDSTHFYLSYPGPTESRNFYLVPSDSFAEMPTIRFRADVRSRPQIYGRDTLEPVFSKPGKYVLTIAHKLESEAASEIHKCTIRIVPNKQ